MFLVPADLENTMYGYQIDQITEGNDDIVLEALAAAEEETRSYLEANPIQKENQDGRFIYDVVLIFSKTGNDRNSLIKQHCLTIAKWHIVQLCNADVIYEQAKDRYDRAIAWLNKLSKGQLTLSSLPVKSIEDDETLQPFSFGSRPKFNHE